jgi:AmmeMemoRadiSam system protein B
MVDARKPAAAGVFYPSERETLANTVHALLESAQAARSPSPLTSVRAIVVPHGRYDRAGAAMAAAWACVVPRSMRLERVVLLGPAHHIRIVGLAAPFADAFATPLGSVAVDRMAIETARRLPQLFVSDVPHDQEHSLEVQLPFLQQVAPSATIVPLIVGDATTEEAAEVLEALWDDATLAVVSADLSEYYDAQTAERVDERTAHAVEALDRARVDPEQVCGHTALRALLTLAQARRLHAVRLALVHAGDQNEVFGYGSFAVGSTSKVAI